MQQKCVPNPFNFDDNLKEYLAKGKMERKLQNEYIPKRSHINQTEYPKGYTFIKLQSQCFAFEETLQYLIYSFSASRMSSRSFHAKPILQYQSQIEILIFEKKNGSYIKKQLKTIQGKVLSMAFCFSSEENQTMAISLLVGTECGLLRRIQFNNAISSQTMQCSCYGIIQIQSTKWPDTCIILLQDQSIQIIHFVNKIILAHLFSFGNPFDTPVSFKIHHSKQYLLQSSKSGTIRVWRMGQDITNAIQNLGKTFNVKPCLVISTLAKKGLIWADFIGDLFALITSQNILKIVAISVNIMNEAEENFQHLLEFNLARHSQDIIFHVENVIKNRCIIISKNRQCKSWLQIIHYDDDYLINKVVIIIIEEFNIHNFIQFKFSQDMHFIIIRSKSGFIIGYQENIFTKTAPQKKNNKSNSDTNDF